MKHCLTDIQSSNGWTANDDLNIFHIKLQSVQINLLINAPNMGSLWKSQIKEVFLI